MNREKAIETVKEFSQEFDLEELIERLVFVEKVKRACSSLRKEKPPAIRK
jgi:hypothetical protein